MVMKLYMQQQILKGISDANDEGMNLLEVQMDLFQAPKLKIPDVILKLD
ncbi:unnamed protein product [Schistosoma curassoni]|uniref:Cytochrome P450 n=1 Tax=Schistosoma curassoni TaxID=6186 RepID=A0A183KGM4_9TREM|nr:unnamed protein product [Schistosoma curassoni]